MANILSQEELDALLNEMKQLREEESRDESPNIQATPSRAYQQESNQMANQPNDVNLEVTLSIPVELSAELGRTRLSIHEILQLTQGSMIELDHKRGPLNLMIKDQLIAQGDVVVKEEKFALRLTEIDPVRDRISKLDR
jgi:flagellar motor switch protein FliN